MSDLQELRDKVSSKVVDLKVEKRRLETLEKNLKDEYNIEAKDVEKAYKVTVEKKNKLEEEYSKKKEVVDEKLQEFGI